MSNLEDKSLFKKKIFTIQIELKGLFSTTYICPECKMEIIRGEGFCDKCGHEFYEIEKLSFFDKLLKMSCLSKFTLLLIIIFFPIFIIPLLILYAWSLFV